MTSGWARSLAAAALVGGLSLTGCAGVGSVVPGSADMSDVRSELTYAASGRDLRTEIVGNPFHSDQATLNTSVTGAMNEAIQFVRTNFTTSPNQTARPDYRMLVVFNPTDNPLSSLLCSHGPFKTGPATGNLQVMVAFCRDSGTLSSATGWISGVTDPNAPAFRSLIMDATRTTFPAQNQNDRCWPVPNGGC